MLSIDTDMPGISGLTLARHLRERNHTRPTLIMLLPPVDRQVELTHCREMGIQNCISKLLKPAELVNALSSSPDASQKQIDAITEDETSAKPAQGVGRRCLNLLLVDDNLFNQKVGKLKLDRLGHQVTLAGSGPEALTLLENITFDIIFMDMHMPEMDGLETTARIRATEVKSGRRTPIVAMTANAGEGAREQCLQGGMNAYVAKPIEDSALLAVIAEVVPQAGGGSAPEVTAEPAQVAASSVINRDALLGRVSGKLAILRQLIDVFTQESPPIMASLAIALRENDCKAVHHQAHTIKGMINFFGVPEISDLAFQLEKMGAAGDCSRGQEIFDNLRCKVEGLQAELNAI